MTVQNLIDLLGYLGTLFVTVAYIPQLSTIIKTKSARDVSSQMYLVLLIGIILWLIYGIFINATPIIIANSITTIFVSLILFFKLKYTRSSLRKKDITYRNFYPIISKRDTTDKFWLSKMAIDCFMLCQDYHKQETERELKNKKV